MIGFVGMSHLGIVSGLAAAAKGNTIIAFDPDPDLVARLEKGIFPVLEPGLIEHHAENRQRIHFVSDPGSLQHCDLVVFSLDVPTDRNNRSDLSSVAALIDQARGRVNDRAVFVILSQVPPGFTRQIAKRFQLNESRVFYQVETLVFGSAVERALKPERFIVGCADPAVSLPKVFAEYLRSFECPILTMRYESAELAKIAINMFLIASVSMTNTLAELCESLGAEWGEIIPALRLDRRIGPYAYLSPGLGIAGGNLERDLATMRHLAREAGTDSVVADACLANNRYRKDWALRCLHSALPSKQESVVVAVLGLTYKPGTASTTNSPALELVDLLKDVSVRTYDPEAPAIAFLSDQVTRVDSAAKACDGADALVVTTAWPEFAKIGADQLRQSMRGNVVIDPYGVLNSDLQEAGFQYFRLGSRTELP